MEILALVIIFLIAIYIQGFLLNLLLFYKLEYSCNFSVDKATEGDNIFLEEIIYNKASAHFLDKSRNIHFKMA